MAEFQIEFFSLADLIATWAIIWLVALLLPVLPIPDRWLRVGEGWLYPHRSPQGRCRAKCGVCWDREEKKFRSPSLMC